MQRSGTLTLADAVFPSVPSDSRALVIARDLALMIGFAAFVALFAQIQVRLPWTTVPITGQTFAVLVAGGALGALRGAGSMGIYMLAGMFFLPVFTPAVSPTSGVWDVHFILPWKGNERLITELSAGGFIVGFILAAGLVGFLAERRWDRGPWVHVAMLLGSLVIYAAGLAWLYYLISTDWVPPGAERSISEIISGSSDLDKALKGGLYPFIVGDLMKLLLAATVLPAAWALVDRVRGRREEDLGSSS
jgi:biotin transport system substrate-specific component